MQIEKCFPLNPGMTRRLYNRGKRTMTEDEMKDLIRSLSCDERNALRCFATYGIDEWDREDHNQQKTLRLSKLRRDRTSGSPGPCD